MLGLVDGKSGLPIYADSISGSVNDNRSFFDMVARDWPTLAGQFKELKYLVGDSALCTAEIMKEAVKKDIHIVTRVPDSYQVAKKCFELGLGGGFEELNPQSPDGCTGMWCGIDKIGDTPVKLLLVNNESMRQSKSKTIQRRAEKQLANMQKELNKLESRPAACRKDAEKNLARIVDKYSRGLRLCRVETVEYEEVLKYPGRGRPKKDAVKEQAGVKVKARAIIDQEAVEAAVTQEVRCVIATTDTTREWSMAEDGVCLSPAERH